MKNILSIVISYLFLFFATGICLAGNSKNCPPYGTVYCCAIDKIGVNRYPFMTKNPNCPPPPGFQDIYRQGGTFSSPYQIDCSIIPCP